MKQLIILLNMLENSGFLILVNWEKEFDEGIIRHCTIGKYEEVVTVLFHIYKENRGYDMYIESKEITFEGDLKELADNLLNK